MGRQAARSQESEPFLRVPRKFAGKKVVLVDAQEYLQLKKRLGEVEDALAKIAGGNIAYRKGRTKIVRSLSELGR